MGHKQKNQVPQCKLRRYVVPIQGKNPYFSAKFCEKFIYITEEDMMNTFISRFGG